MGRRLRSRQDGEPNEETAPRIVWTAQAGANNRWHASWHPKKKFAAAYRSSASTTIRVQVLGRRDSQVLWHPVFQDCARYYGFHRPRYQRLRARLAALLAYAYRTRPMR